MSISVCDSRWVGSHAYYHYLRVKHSLPSCWGVERVLERLCSLYFFLLALSFTIVFGIFKKWLPSEWKSVFTQLIGVQVRWACTLTRATFYSIVPYRTIFSHCPSPSNFANKVSLLFSTKPSFHILAFTKNFKTIKISYIDDSHEYCHFFMYREKKLK